MLFFFDNLISNYPLKISIMKPSLKIFYAVLAVVVIACVTVLVSQTDLLQGRMKTKLLPAYDAKTWFLYKSKLVSVVVSPVTSVIESKVTSPRGTSKVLSIVTTPVASTVAPRTPPTNVPSGGWPSLTGDILKTLEKMELSNNPAKFRLSPQVRQKVLDLYRTTHKVK